MQTGKQCPLCKYGEVIERFNKRLRKRFLGCACFPGCVWTYSPNTTKQASINECLQSLPGYQQNIVSGPVYNKSMTLLPTGKPHISYSEVSCWMECSWRHKLQHVLKLGTFKPSIHLIFGTACHMAVQSLLQTKISDTTAARAYIVSELEKCKDDEDLATTDVDKTVATIQKILDDTLAFFEESFPKWELVSIEESLYEDVAQFFEAHEGISFKGFIDVIMKVPTKKEGEFLYWIVDLKTASRPWMLDKIKDAKVRAQLVLYKKFWSEKHNVPLNKIRCGFVTLLKSGKSGKLIKLIPISVGEKSVEKTLNVLNNSLASIKRGAALKNRASCRWCEFKDTEHCT